MSKRLDVNDPEVFNKWRALYNELSDKEQFDFYDDLEKKYPVQRSYNFNNIREVFKHVPIHCHILEVGGWKGELALEVFQSDIQCVSSWNNIEICKSAIAKEVENLDKFNYNSIYVETFNWFKNQSIKDLFSEVNLLISCHMLEHLSDQDAKDFLEYTSECPFVYIEAPIAKTWKNNWHNYIGTHILTMSWEDIIQHMKTLGHKPILNLPDAILFQKVN